MVLLRKETDAKSQTHFHSYCLGVLQRKGKELQILTAQHCFYDSLSSSQPFPFHYEGKNYSLTQNFYGIFSSEHLPRPQKCLLKPNGRKDHNLQLFSFVQCEPPLSWLTPSLYQTGLGTGKWGFIHFNASPKATQTPKVHFFFGQIIHDHYDVLTLLTPKNFTPCRGQSGSGLYFYQKGQFYLRGILEGGPGTCEENQIVLYQKPRFLF